jgi:hypothetical protein
MRGLTADAVIAMVKNLQPIWDRTEGVAPREAMHEYRLSIPTHSRIAILPPLSSMPLSASTIHRKQ